MADSQTHQGKMLEAYIKLNKVNVDKTLLPKLEKKISRGTLYKLYTQEKIDPEYVRYLLEAGIDFLGQSPTTRIKQNLSFPQKESGLTEKVRGLEERVAQLERSLLDLYSRLPKPM